MQLKYQDEAQILEAQQTPVLQLQKENIKTEQLKKTKIETIHLESTEENSVFKFGSNSVHILVDTGALVPSGIAISGGFFCNHLGGGGTSRFSLLRLKSANDATHNRMMTTLGVWSLENWYFGIFIPIPIILGVNFLKHNSLSPFFTPRLAQLVHTPYHQIQNLITNVVEINLNLPPPLLL